MIPARAFLLMIGDDGALLVPPLHTGKGVATLFAAGHDDAHALPLLEAMGKKPNTPVLIVTDVLAQEYRRETLPRLNPFDRRKLLVRRLAQTFPAPAAPHAQLTGAQVLTGRAALLVCLHDGDPMTLWMKRIESRTNPFAGVLPLPLAAAGIVARLDPEAAQGWAMLLSRQRTGGFRQIVTHNGQLVFTRLTPPISASVNATGMTSSLALDLQATLGYLARQGLTTNEPLRLVALLPNLGPLPPPLETVATLSPYDAAQRLGLSFAPDLHDTYADLLFAAWIANAEKVHPFLPEQNRRTDRTGRIRRWGRTAASAVWLAAIASLGLQADGLFRLMQKHDAAIHRTVWLEQQWEKTKAELAPVTEPLGRLRQAVARKRLFSAPAALPWPVLAKLGKTAGSEARVTRFDWNPGEGKTEPETWTISLRLTDSGLPSTAHESGRQAVIRQFDQLAQNFAAALPGFAVSITHYPFLVKPDETLSNAGNKENDTVAPIAAFMLRRLP